MWIIVIIAIIIIAIVILRNNGKRSASSNQSSCSNNDIMDAVNRLASESKNTGSYWRNFKNRKPQVAKEIEEVIGKDMSKLSDIDVFQIVTMLQRVSNNAKLPISGLKRSVYDQLFSHCSSESEIDEIISRLKSEKNKRVYS